MLYMNLETGELLTYRQMIKEGGELYDLNDPTNAASYGDYYIGWKDGIYYDIDLY